MGVMRSFQGVQGTIGQPTAQVIDGSLKFDDDFKTSLSRSVSTAGNRRTWTFSCWLKKSKLYADSTYQNIFSSLNTGTIQFDTIDQLRIYDNAGGATREANSVRMRDTNGWYHIVVKFDTTQATDTDRVFIYLNGEDISKKSGSWPSQNYQSPFNAAQTHYLGTSSDSNNYLPGLLSQVYLIDGQALGPEYFGFTDPLTNTWKPKKYTGTFGTNGFWLPMDGNSPIGQDKSGNGNDWTPVNFGGSLELDNPNVSGARPILNTTQGGAQAGVGVFGSRENVGYAVTVYNDGGGNKYYIDGVKQATLTGLIRGATYTFDTSDSTIGSTHPFRLSATSAHGTEYTNGVAAITGAATTITIPYNAPETLYYYCTAHSGMGSSITGISTNEKLADQYASNIVFASPLVGANSDVSASIACTSSTKTMTSNGNAAVANERSNFYSGSFEFDGNGDYIASTETDIGTFGTGDFTVEYWCWNNSTQPSPNYSPQVGNLADGTAGGTWRVGTFQSNGYLTFATHNGSGFVDVTFNTINYNDEVWHHFCVQRSSGTVTAYVDGISIGTNSVTTDFNAAKPIQIGREGYSPTYYTGYIQDLRIYKGVAKYTSDFVVPSRSPDVLPDTPSGVSGSSKVTKITDGAVALNEAGTTSDASYLSVASSSDFAFGTGDFTIEYYLYLNSTPTTATVPFDMRPLNTNGAYPQMTINSSLSLSYYVDSSNRITSSSSIPTKQWLHISVCRSGSSTKMFVNGVQSGSTYSDSNNYQQSGINIGSNQYAVQYGIPGFITNFRVIKGTALYTSNFTPPTRALTNVTNTKLLCCQSNSSAVNYAVSPGTISGIGTVAATNFNPFNTNIDTVRGQETGYATWNPLTKGSRVTLSNGNLDVSSTASAGNASTMECVASIQTNSGKFYVEWTNISNRVASLTRYEFAGTGLDIYDGGVNNDLGGTTSGSGFSISDSDVVGLAVDFDNKIAYAYKNGVLNYTANYTTTLPLFFKDAVNSSTASGTSSANFGQKPFKFPPPDGFQPLTTANVRPNTVIARPDQYVGVLLYTGDGGSSNSISGLNFGGKPDLVWVKGRSYDISHLLYDSVRGAGSTKSLVPNGQNTEGSAGDNATYGYVSSLDHNGFSLVGGSDVNNGYVNKSSATYAAWCWRAGGNKNTFNVDGVGYATFAASGTTAGDITPTGTSIGTKQGFSIIKYTGSGTSGDTLPHGLSQTPDLIITKCLDASSIDWIVKPVGLLSSESHMLILNGSNAEFQGTGGHISAQSSTTVTLTEGSNDGNYNNAGDSYVMYAWHSVPGLQKFGKYTGNLDADGPYVELGFKPALIIVKEISPNAGQWNMYDSKRSTINPTAHILWANQSVVENSSTYIPDVTSNNMDILSNGFKLRSNKTGTNRSGGSYLYMAWAEAPASNLFGGQSNAR